MATGEIRVGEDPFHGEILKQGFAPNLDDWSEEGLGHFTLVGSTMHVDARMGGYTAFWRTPLPADMAVRFVGRTLPPLGQNNLNLISHCQPKTTGVFPVVPLGRYKGYQELVNYIVTFVGDWDEDARERRSEGRTRLRRNPGFDLIDETHLDSLLETDYEVVFTSLRGRIRYYIDGVKRHDWTDPNPHPGGLFALRTYKTVLDYKDILILALK